MRGVRRSKPRAIGMDTYRYRLPTAALVLLLPDESHGMISNVVFSTAADVRRRCVDVYYRAADNRIAVATTEVGMPILVAPSAPVGTLSVRRSCRPGM
jgi:hypothetical protein